MDCDIIVAAARLNNGTTNMPKITGGELLAKSIVACGVKYVFTASCDALEPVIKKLEREKFLTSVRANTETAAAAMADGFGRRTRTCAAVLTGDRGAALAQMSAVTNAWADKVPMLSLSLCSDAAPDPNKGVERERFDQTRVFSPVTIWRERISSVEDIPEIIGRAVTRSNGSLNGPVHIDIPHSMLNAKIDQEVLERIDGLFGANRFQPLRARASEEGVERAAELLKRARKPLVVTGGGISASDAYAQVLSFVESFGIPAATTMSGVGNIPIDHEMCIGGPSYTAGEAFHVAIKNADVVVAAGVGFGGLEGFGLPPFWSDKIKFIHIDISQERFGLNALPEVSLLGDAATVLDQMSEKLNEDGFKGAPEWRKWRNEIAALKKGRRERLLKDAESAGGKIHQGKLAALLDIVARRDDLMVVIDGGNTPLYAAMYATSTKPRQCFFPFGMASLGSGIPFAIGAQLASPEKRAILFTGDGSLMYNIQELETIRRLNLPITIIVNNDSAWNMIKAMQDSFFARNYVGTELPDIDYAGVAEGFGVWNRRVYRAEDVIPAYEAAKALNGPALIDCVTDSKNIPDSLLSFTMVEFEGSLESLDPVRLAESMWKMRDVGPHRMAYLGEYILKSFLQVNPGAKRRGRK